MFRFFMGFAAAGIGVCILLVLVGVVLAFAAPAVAASFLPAFTPVLAVGGGMFLVGFLGSIVAEYM